MLSAENLENLPREIREHDRMMERQMRAGPGEAQTGSNWCNSVDLGNGSLDGCGGRSRIG